MLTDANRLIGKRALLAVRQAETNALNLVVIETACQCQYMAASDAERITVSPGVR